MQNFVFITTESQCELGFPVSGIVELEERRVRRKSTSEEQSRAFICPSPDRLSLHRKRDRMILGQLKDTFTDERVIGSDSDRMRIKRERVAVARIVKGNLPVALTVFGSECEPPCTVQYPTRVIQINKLPDIFRILNQGFMKICCEKRTDIFHLLLFHSTSPVMHDS